MQAPQQFWPKLTLAWIELAQHLLAFGAKLVSIALMSTILFYSCARPNYLRVKSFSLCMRFYLCFHCVASTLGLPYVAYLLFWDIPNILAGDGSSPYDPYAMYWLGIFEFNYITISPSLATFLAIERCLILRKKSIGSFKQERAIFLVSVLVVCAAWIGSWVALIAFELPLQLEKLSDCMVMSCATLRTLNLPQLAMKIAFGGCNLLFCGYFLWLLRQSTFTANLKNKVVKWSIVSEFFFNTLLAFSYFTFNKIFGTSLSLYVGELGFTLCPVDALVCSIAYWLILVKRKREIEEERAAMAKMNVVIPSINGWIE